MTLRPAADRRVRHRDEAPRAVDAHDVAFVALRPARERAFEKRPEFRRLGGLDERHDAPSQQRVAAAAEQRFGREVRGREDALAVERVDRVGGHLDQVPVARVRGGGLVAGAGLVAHVADRRDEPGHGPASANRREAHRDAPLLAVRAQHGAVEAHGLAPHRAGDVPVVLGRERGRHERGQRDTFQRALRSEERGGGGVGELDHAAARGDEDRVGRGLDDEAIALRERVEPGHVVDGHDRAARGVRRGDEVEHLARPRLPYGAAADLAANDRRAQRVAVVHLARLAEEHGVERAADERHALAEPREGGQPSVVSRDEALAVEHRHAAGDRIERRAQLARRVARLLVEPRVDHRERELRGEALEHARVVVGEVRGAVGDRQHADRAVGREQRRRDDLLRQADRPRALLHFRVRRHAVRHDRALFQQRTARVALRDRRVEAERRHRQPFRGDDVQELAAPQRDDRPLRAQDRGGVPERETQHLGQLQREPERRGEIGECLALPLLAEALREEARVHQRRRGGRPERREEVLILAAERGGAVAVHRKHAHDPAPRAQRHREHRGRRPGGEARASGLGDGLGDDRRARGILLEAVAPVQHDARPAALDRPRDDDPGAGDDARDVPRELALDVVAVQRTRERRADLLQALQPLRPAFRERDECLALEDEVVDDLRQRLGQLEQELVQPRIERRRRGAGPPGLVAHPQNRQTRSRSRPNCLGVGAKPRALASRVQSTALDGGSMPPESVSAVVS